MPAQSSKGAVAPSSKQEARTDKALSEERRSADSSSDKPQQPRGPVAIKGDIPPAGVLEDSSMVKEKADTKPAAKAATKAADTPVVQDIVNPPHSGNYTAGLKREASVLTDLTTGATVVISDRVKSPLTLDTLEVLVETLPEEEHQGAMDKAVAEVSDQRSEAATGAPETD